MVKAADHVFHSPVFITLWWQAGTLAMAGPWGHSCPCPPALDLAPIHGPGPHFSPTWGCQLPPQKCSRVLVSSPVWGRKWEQLLVSQMNCTTTLALNRARMWSMEQLYSSSWPQGQQDKGHQSPVPPDPHCKGWSSPGPRRAEQTVSWGWGRTCVSTKYLQSFSQN